MLSLKKNLNYFLYKNHCVTIQRIVQEYASPSLMMKDIIK